MLSYYIKEFPISKLTNHGEEGWTRDPYHIRNRYKYLEAIVEDIETSGIFEPVIVTQFNNDFCPGAHGVNRLAAIIRHTDRKTFPAILNTNEVLDAPLVTTKEQLQTYYKRNLLDPKVAEVNFTQNGIQISSWGSFSVDQIEKSFSASDNTKERVIDLFAVEHLHNMTLDIENTDPEQLSYWCIQYFQNYNYDYIDLFSQVSTLESIIDLTHEDDVIDLGSLKARLEDVEHKIVRYETATPPTTKTDFYKWLQNPLKGE